LGRAIYCFLQQTYPDTYLLVLDDCGQYKSQKHGRWELVSTRKRYKSLGAKRQAGVEMLPPDCEGYLCWDDDDCHWPHAVSAVAKALEEKPWAQCRLVLETAGKNTLAVTQAFGQNRYTRQEIWGYGGCWAYRLDGLREVGGYDMRPERSSNDDVDLARKFYARYGASADSTAHYPPWYYYNRDPGVDKVSEQGPNFWEKRAVFPYTQMDSPPIGWNGKNLYDYNITSLDDPRPLGWQENKEKIDDNSHTDFRRLRLRRTSSRRTPTKKH
jgi:hypothetical protein